MPQTRLQQFFFAAVTVLITVNAFLFYSIFVVNGSTLTEYASMASAQTITSVPQALSVLGGITMFGRTVPVWAVAIVEFCCALTLELLMGSPCSIRLALRAVPPQKNPSVLVETAVICTTVCIMCPAMSLIAAFMYFPYGMLPFDIQHVLIEWGRLVCLNLPFAFFGQLFFIQPAVRAIFRGVFLRNKIAYNAAQ